MLSADPQRLPAGDEQLKPAGGMHHAGEVAGSIHGVLEVVQDQQQVTTTRRRGDLGRDIDPRGRLDLHLCGDGRQDKSPRMRWPRGVRRSPLGGRPARPASSTASLVLPTPPGPAMVTKGDRRAPQQLLDIEKDRLAPQQRVGRPRDGSPGPGASGTETSPPDRASGSPRCFTWTMALRTCTRRAQSEVNDSCVMLIACRSASPDSAGGSSARNGMRAPVDEHGDERDTRSNAVLISVATQSSGWSILRAPASSTGRRAKPDRSRPRRHPPGRPHPAVPRRSQSRARCCRRP